MKTKKYLPIILGWLLLPGLFACRQKTEYTSPEQLGRDVFQAVCTNDLVLLQKHIVTKKDRDNILDSAVVYNANLEDVKNAIDSKISGWKQHDRQVLNDLREEGKQKGIIWEQARLGSVDYTIISGNGRGKTDIYVHFTAGSAAAILRLDDCLLTQRGWIIYDDITLQ